MISTDRLDEKYFRDIFNYDCSNKKLIAFQWKICHEMRIGDRRAETERDRLKQIGFSFFQGN